MNSVPKLFSCSYADCWTEKHFSTEFGVLTSNHTHSHTLFWGCVSRWFGRALAWHARGQRFDPAILHQKSTVLRRKYGAFLFAFLEVTLKISQMPDFAGVWTATPNSCCFVVFENACSMPDCFAGGRITPPQYPRYTSTLRMSWLTIIFFASKFALSYRSA